ncbi:AmmeMemoRadiSam system radical SAM enzyme [Candidatus Microgenomates bacterium]|nr:AmmeMemoRadiSam system radical SAM enzyme [Candidatus Microgenomates bacterium]
MKKNQLGFIFLFIILALAIFPIIKFAFLKKEKADVSEILSEVEELHEAKFYEKLSGGRIQCNLCPNRCILAPGQRGICKVRENRDGKLYSLVYGKPISINVDPIEKKPFYHFLPTTRAYSLSTVGCNLSCKFCQNWNISQRFPEDVNPMEKSPEEVVQEALDAEAETIAFTYNEPTVWYEYMYDIAKLAKERDLKTVMISAGYINPEPFNELLEVLDAVRIDLKGFTEEYYQEIVGGKLEPVLESLKIAYQSGTWLEIINLIVPGKNDSDSEIRAMCQWIKDNLSEDVPLHFLRFHPDYKMKNLPSTPIETLKKAREIAQEVGLNYVYAGNVPEYIEGNTTFCPDNDESLIIRKGFFVTENKVDENGQNPICPSKIPGVWQ